VLAVVHVPVAPALPPGPAKPADRSAWDAAMAQARRLGAHQALLADPDGEVIDGGTATAWLVSRGTLVTPPAPPAVPGVARAWLLDHAAALGLTASIARVSPEDLDLAQEVFLTNAFAGCVGARGRRGPVTERVREAFAAL
jgi:branched-subunit amino acid aminotransferase/4-amino-4-deoxychorismate lyase